MTPTEPLAHTQAAPAPADAAADLLPTGATGTLRGAAVDVDARRAGRIVAALAIAALAVTGACMAVAAHQANAQITTLRQHGVPVEATVTGCVSLVGGSGSNVAGFQCTADYTVAGATYSATVPGIAPHQVGDRVGGIVASGDPALFTTPAALASSQPSARAYLVPAGLVITAGVAGGLMASRRRRRRWGGGLDRPAHRLPVGTAARGVA